MARSGAFGEDMEAILGAEEVPLRVKRLHPDVPLPTYAHRGDAGLDVCAAQTVTIPPGGRVAVSTGLAVAVPEGWVGLIHPRSGLALRHGLTVLNAPGTIDAGYRGEVKVILVNHGGDPTTVRWGDRVAQLVLQRVGRAGVIEVESLEETARGGRGFGSTGSAAR